ncbi:MAG TPA: peptidylprolyl isomerase [Candidatus Hydrogenedentes bacterium]|nr:peptidylprolyl isomerase [Candidatus Hydrogenedentota bacterium]HPG70201.1 peptidylprolyl isomerase [Candidatus Hydrogenedentota bacterium]
MAILVNGERVDDARIEEAKQQLASQTAARPGPPEWEARGMDLEAFAKEMVIARALIQQEAKARPALAREQDVAKEVKRLRAELGSDEAFRDFLQRRGLTEPEFRTEVRNSMAIDRLLDQACKDVADPTDEEVRAYYDANPDRFAQPELVHAAHIVKHVQGNILDFDAAHGELHEVRERLGRGEDFAALARQHSDCPDNGGDLGFFPRGTMVPEFDEVVFALETGATSAVFQTSFGLHIAKVFERVPTRPQPLDDVRDEVRQTLRDERENAAIDAFTETLKARATIEEIIE